MRRKRNIVFLTLSMVLIFCFQPFSARGVAPMEEGMNIIEELKLFSRALGAILEGYVEKKEPRELFYEAVKGMTASLDEYSQFFYPEQYELVQISIKGEYAGIGARLEIVGDLPAITEIAPGGPAEKAGLKIDDRILEIDSQSTKGKPLSEISSLLRGEAGTSVHLSVFRPALEKTLTLEVVRETLEIQSVRDVRMVGKALGYLRIVDFQENTTEQVTQALQQLHKQGMQALIIDLRGNMGGVMTEAVELAEKFLPQGLKIVSVQSRIPEQQKEFISTAKEVEPYYPIVILVNQATASASEIFTAAMQDHGRAKVVGAKTFGKASVQSVVPLDDKAAMKITTARYVSPAGRVIDRVGIVPDEEIENKPPDQPGSDLQTRRALEMMKQYL